MCKIQGMVGLTSTYDGCSIGLSTIENRSNKLFYKYANSRTYTHTDGHHDSKTELAQWGDSMKMQFFAQPNLFGPTYRHVLFLFFLLLPPARSMTTAPSIILVAHGSDARAPSSGHPTHSSHAHTHRHSGSLVRRGLSGKKER